LFYAMVCVFPLEDSWIGLTDINKAGGGTVDLISYKVTQLNPKLQLSEAARGTGSACGSIFLDLEFKKFLVAKLSHLEGWRDSVLNSVGLPSG
jgi:hypothetical protein